MCVHECCFCGVACQDHHLHTVKMMTVTAKPRHTAFMYLSLWLLDIRGNTALEQWKHVAWLLSGERRLSCRDYYLNFKSYIIAELLVMIKQSCKIYCLYIWLCFKRFSLHYSLKYQIHQVNILSFVIFYAIHNLFHKSLCALTSLLSFPLLAFTWINKLGVLHEGAHHTLGIYCICTLMFLWSQSVCSSLSPKITHLPVSANWCGFHKPRIS